MPKIKTWKNCQFLTKTLDWPLWKKLNFLALLTFCLESGFFFLEYGITHLPVVFCLKNKKMEKLPFFDWNYGLTPLKKSKFLGLINMLFLKPRKAFFSFLEHHQTHFHVLFWLKNKYGKIANFRSNPWTNRFGKTPIFPPFLTCYFCCVGRRFFFLGYRGPYFRGLFCLT